MWLGAVSAQIARFNVTWADLKSSVDGGRVLDEGDCIIATENPYGECVGNLEVGMHLRMHGDHRRWKGIGFTPMDAAEGNPRLLVENIPDGGEDMIGITPGRDMNSNYMVLWKAERTGIIRPGDDLYQAYLIVDARENMEDGIVYDFNWQEDADGSCGFF